MQLVEQLKKLIADLDVISFGYLFGSYADKTYTQKSDVDVALYLDDTSLDTRLQIIYELSKALQKDVDLIVLNDLKNIYLLDDVLQKGIVLKDDEKRIDFELKKQHEILDYKSFKKMIDAA